MADRNWHQQFLLNPAAAAQNDDLFYLARTPYLTDGSDDFVINWQNLLASIQAQIQGGYTWSLVTGTVPMAVQHGYITNDNATIVTFTLPAAPVLGDSVKITGLGTAGWTLTLSGTQKIHMGGGNITQGTGSISSTNQHDSITLRASSTNVWIVEASIGQPATT